MKIIFVRHGETLSNQNKIIQDNHTSELSPQGIKQAEKLSLALSKEKIDKIYCSDTKRTKQTLEKIKKHQKNIPIELTKELREQEMGELVGIPINELIEKIGEENFFTFKAKNGESKIDQIKRIKKFLDKIIPEHEKETILLIGHKGTNYAIKEIFFGDIKNPKREKNPGQKNCCINIIEIKNKIPEIIKFNDTSHLF